MPNLQTDKNVGPQSWQFLERNGQALPLVAYIPFLKLATLGSYVVISLVLRNCAYSLNL